MTLRVANRQVFKASGTWYKPAAARVVRVQLVGAGSGGGGGSRGAIGANRIGGGGGAAGTYLDAWYTASDLPSSVAVTLGAAGAGGAGAVADSTSGSPGPTGGLSRFGTLLVTAPSWQAAAGGSIGVNVGGAANLGQNAAFPGIGGAGSNPGAQGANQAANPQPGGGNGGGGALAANTPIQNLFNGINNVILGDPNVQTFGVLGGGDATPVASPLTLEAVGYAIPWYSGAGGGGTTGGVTGSKGGNGGTGQGYGAGGGGGGSATNTFTAGNGGAGAPGLAIITSYR